MQLVVKTRPRDPVVRLPGGRLALETWEYDDEDQIRGHGKVIRRRRMQYVLDRLAALKRPDGEPVVPGDHILAGDAFRQDFQTAHLSGIKLASMERIDMAWRPSGALGAVEHCKRRIFRDIEALGGIGTLGARCMWHVVGIEEAAMDWAALNGVPRESVPAILMTALGVIARVRNPS